MFFGDFVADPAKTREGSNNPTFRIDTQYYSYSKLTLASPLITLAQEGGAGGAQTFELLPSTCLPGLTRQSQTAMSDSLRLLVDPQS